MTSQPAPPLHILGLVHAALREDLVRIEAAARLPEAHTQPGRTALMQRCEFFGTYLSDHDVAESAVLFPVAEQEAPSSTLVFKSAHRHIRQALNSLGDALASGTETQVCAAIARMRAVVDLHLDMEDESLLPACVAAMSPTAQLVAIGRMSEHMSMDIRMRATRWMPPLLSVDDREKLLRFYLASTPEGPLTSVLQSVRTALSSADWQELKHRIPELP